jgi:tetratricopeptide (TPR) repeat protein
LNLNLNLNVNPIPPGNGGVTVLPIPVPYPNDGGGGQVNNLNLIDPYYPPQPPEVVVYDNNMPVVNNGYDPGTQDANTFQPGGVPDQGPPTIDDFNAALRNDPTNAALYLQRGNLWVTQQQYAAAMADFDQAIRIAPAFAAAWNARGWLRATCPDARFRDGRSAYADGRRACELTQWADGSIVDTLAAAFAEAGDFANAIKLGERAVQLCSNDPNTQQEVLMHLAYFRAGQPFRENPGGQ